MDMKYKKTRDIKGAGTKKIENQMDMKYQKRREIKGAGTTKR